jgi:arylsulfate sulfotransferase
VIKARTSTRLFLLAALPSVLTAQMSVAISSSAGPSVQLGTPVTWTAMVSGASTGTLAYRFQVRPTGGDFHTVVDYGPKSALTWTSIDREGSYQVEVSVQNYNTGQQASADAMQRFISLMSGATPVVTPSANPLVYIYSAPPCMPGARMIVRFQSPDGFIQATGYKPCLPESSMNFYLAGMRPAMAYLIQHTIDNGRTVEVGPLVPFTPASVATYAPALTMLGPEALPQGLLLQSLFGQPSVATDLQGNMVWASPPDIGYLTRPITGGTFLGIGQDGTQGPDQQFFREFDLAGIAVAETNAAQVNQQLTALGVHPINGFHHEAQKLPSGGYLVLADSERILTNVQGPGPVDVIGDTILVLNQDLQVTWAWDSFDYMDTYRLATLGEQCTYPAGLACEPFYLSTTANDWLHGNALQLTPEGNILYSARHQDWVIKIDYANGSGSGEILWRMGLSGDFRMVSTDLNPWFSHQHDAKFEMNGTLLLVFDNGNVRQARDPTAHSRGQALQVDERNRIVTTLLNADLGVYSVAVGSAQLLPDGNFHFDAGFLIGIAADGNPLAAESFQVEPTGTIDFGLQFGTAEYRTFRMPDLYTAPEDALLRSIVELRTAVR